MIPMENECKVTLFKIIHRSYCEKVHDYKIYFTLSNLTKRFFNLASEGLSNSAKTVISKMKFIIINVEILISLISNISSKKLGS